MKKLHLLFAATILLSSFLLFQVQPIIGKYILPWFGGTSFVWITSLLFFQLILLLGYLYTYLLTNLSRKKQVIIHSFIIFFSVLLTTLLFFHWPSPITPSLAWKSADWMPVILQVLALLTISVGIPYFLLTTTSTLLQKWFSQIPHNKSPYPLYAISNIGSLAAIITYPFFIEPFFSLHQQGIVWSSLFLFLCFLLWICGYAIMRRSTHNETTEQSLHKGFGQIRKTWLLLPGISSLVLLAGTHQLTQGIAPIPFLWLLPLGIYLISFILCFSEKPFYNRTFQAYLFLICLPIILAFLLAPPYFGVLPELILYSIFFFSCFMLCHGELFSERPKSADLNIYYVSISFGSVIGALIVAIIAPILFVGLFWEFLLGLYLTALVALLTLLHAEKSLFYTLFRKVFLSPLEMKIFFSIVVSVFFGIIGIGLYYLQMNNTHGIWRNFYGTLKISDIQTPDGTMKCLMNGAIIHGCQSSEQRTALQPITYYGKGAIGLVFQSIRQHHKTISVGDVGLGIGTLAAYGKKGDSFTFYEINPMVLDLAQTQFSFLSGTPATTNTIIGDGRLAIEKQLAQGKEHLYDLLIVDAFNDDAIPVHLLTKEAFADYLKILKPHSILVVHISNSYIDLSPVIKSVADYYHLNCVIITALPQNKMENASKWAFLSDDASLLQTKEIKAAHKNEVKKDIQMWTDTYSNLFQLLKFTSGK